MPTEPPRDATPPPEEPAAGPETYDLEPEGEEVVRADDATRRGTALRTAEPPSPLPGPDATPAATAMARRPDAPFTGGLGGLRATACIAGAAVLLALIAVGVRGQDTSLPALAMALCASLLSMAINGALGTLAVIAAARCVGTRVAEPELFALRMLAAAAAFTLLFSIGTPIPSAADDWLLGLAGYAAAVWLLFRIGPAETGLVLAWHGGLLGLLLLHAAMTRPGMAPAAGEPGDAPAAVRPAGAP